MGMDEPKHSPGPWRAEGYRIRDRDGNDIAGLGPGADYEGTADYANARLIAAAPELLALMREKSRYNAGYTRGNCHCPMMDPDMERFIEPDGSCWDCMVRALIARVDGKAG